MSLWEAAAIMESWNRMHSGEDDEPVEAPTAEEWWALAHA